MVFLHERSRRRNKACVGHLPTRARTSRGNVGCLLLPAKREPPPFACCVKSCGCRSNCRRKRRRARSWRTHRGRFPPSRRLPPPPTPCPATTRARTLQIPLDTPDIKDIIFNIQQSQAPPMLEYTRDSGLLGRAGRAGTTLSSQIV